MQHRVTLALNYAIGGDSPFESYPCGADANRAEECVAGLRRSLADGSCRLGEAEIAEVCGLQASQRLITCNDDADPAWTGIASCGEELDRCWGAGASGFFYSENSTRGTYIDPEPVKLTQNLTDSTGATAAGVFVNTSLPTTVRRWNPDGASGTVAAGTPCATGALPVNGITSKIIHVRPSGFRECY